MKKNTKKILCLILSIIMILGTLPVTVLAGTTGPVLKFNYSVSYNKPKAGEAPGEFRVLHSRNGEVFSGPCFWKLNGESFSGTFKGGTTYELRIVLKESLYKEILGNQSTIKINGETVQMSAFKLEEKRLPTQSGKPIIIKTYVYTDSVLCPAALSVKTIDKELKINNITPGAGLTPSLTAVVTEGCRVQRFDWMDVTSQETEHQMEDTEEFVYGNTYQLQFFLEALPGYKFPEGGPDLTVGVTQFRKSRSGDQYVYSAFLESTYYGVDVVEINTPTPRHGGKTEFCTPEAPSGTDYKVSQSQWDCTAFTYGTDANLDFLIETKNDFTYFSDTVKVKFNGSFLPSGYYSVITSTENGAEVKKIQGLASVKPEKGIISSLEFSGITPVAGQTPSSELRGSGASKDLCPVVSVVWWTNDGGWRTLEKDEKLTADGEYKLSVTADINSNYIVTEDSPVIRNENIYVEGFSSVVIQNYHNNDISFSCIPDKIYPADELLNFISFDFTKYVLADMRGDDADEVFGFSNGTSAGFTLYDVEWDSEDTQDFRDNFVEGKKYTAKIILEADAGKSFTSETKVRVNGKMITAREIYNEPAYLIVTVENIPCKKTVNEVTINFTYPENGGEPNPDFSCADTDVRLANSWWTPHNALFEAGKEYTLHTLLVPEANVIFKDLKVKFNGNAALGELNFPGITEGNVEIEKIYTCLTRYFEKVNVALNIPEKGTVPSDYADTDAGEAEIVWTPADAIFMAGKTYTCKVTVKAAKGDEFRDYVKLFLNGEKIENITKSKTEITFEKSYTIPEEEVIDIISFEGLVFPEEGKNPVFTCSANGRNYIGTWKDVTAGKNLSEADVFEGGHSYSFSVDVNAGDKVFASSLAILSDGTDQTMNTVIELSPDKNNCTVTFAEYPCFKKVNTVEVTGITAPVDSAPAELNCTVSAGTVNPARSSWRIKGTDTKVTEFKGGNTYTLYLYIDKTSAIEFEAGCTATVNGAAANAAAEDSGRAVIITMDFECKQPEPPKPAKITSGTLKIEGGFIEGIIAPVKVADIMKQINENADCKITDINGKALTGEDNIGTGAVISLIVDGKTADTVTVVVKGDVNGDGEISAADARTALRIAVKLESGLKSAQNKAADVAAEPAVTSADARHILRVAVKLEEM